MNGSYSILSATSSTMGDRQPECSKRIVETSSSFATNILWENCELKRPAPVTTMMKVDLPTRLTGIGHPTNSLRFLAAESIRDDNVTKNHHVEAHVG
jgi:hypothetical protein